MITVAKLRRKPRHFRAFTGLSVAEFDRLLAEVTPAYTAALAVKQQRVTRQRQVGGGRKFALDLAERLLLGLMYLRLYVRQSLLAYLFDLDESNVSRELHERLLPILEQVLPTPLRDAPLRDLAADNDAPSSAAAKSSMGDPAATTACQPVAEQPHREAAAKSSMGDPAATAKPRKRIGTLAELVAAYPELAEVLVDATEQSIPQPQDKRKRKLAYSGKQQMHTVKTQIVATKRTIVHVFGNLPGSVSDMLLLRASGVLHKLPQGCTVRVDKGYEGTHRAYPHLDVAQPIKKPRKQPQNVLARAYNHLLSCARIYVEHHFARLQTFGCLAQVWRGRPDHHEDYFCIVAGLLNFRRTGHLQLVP